MVLYILYYSVHIKYIVILYGSVSVGLIDLLI